MFKQYLRCAAPLLAAVLLIALAPSAAITRDAPKRFMPLLSTGKTVMDETIVYPTGAPAKITTGIVTLEPGDETGWHTHGVPLTGIVLEGRLTVDYGDKGTKTFREGESIAEAINVAHNGKNLGAGRMRLFVVFIGTEGLETTKPVKP